MIDILLNFHEAFLGGLAVSLELLLLIALIGIPLGIILGVLGGRIVDSLGSIISGVHFIIGAIPALVLLFWIHYPLQSLLGIVINPFWTTVVALGLVNCIMTAELVRRELKLFPESYREVAKTLGLSTNQIAKFIELPILMGRITPQLLANQGLMLTYTLFASLISVPELFRVAQNVNASIYRPVEVYSLLVVFFLIILGPLYLLVGYLKKKYGV